MHHWIIQARRRAAEIHDIAQLAAGATAFAAVLVFVILSGRSQDDPVVRWLAEVGATMITSEIITPADSASLSSPAAPLDTPVFQPDASRDQHHTNATLSNPY